jgi:alpha-beta hydrolase superfamily lysophospholipase
MQQNEGLFEGADGMKLYYRCWLPDSQTRAAVIIVHGFSDHCGRYDNLVRSLLRRRLAVYSYDLRGHGQSPGKQGHVQEFTDYREDTHSFIQFVARQQPDRPLYLFGHSMGGLIALDQALSYPASIRGVIASAPHLGNPPVSAIKLSLSRLLSRLWPSFTMDAGLDETALSRDQAAVQAYRDDPLVHGRGSARLSTELEAAVDQTQANASRLKMPLLIYGGTADRLTDPEDSRRFYEQAGSADKHFVLYEGGLHENHNDIHGERVVIEVAQWIEEHVALIAQEQEPQDSVDG